MPWWIRWLSSTRRRSPDRDVSDGVSAGPPGDLDPRPRAGLSIASLHCVPYGVMLTSNQPDKPARCGRPAVRANSSTLVFGGLVGLIGLLLVGAGSSR